MVVLLQYDWPQGEMLFLKAIEKICQQGSFQYENFFNYVTSILCFSSLMNRGRKSEFVNKIIQITSLCSLLVSINSCLLSDIDMLEEFAYLRTPEGGRIQLELLPNQGMLIK